MSNPLSHLTGICLTLLLCLSSLPAAQAAEPGDSALQYFACTASIELFMQVGTSSVSSDRPELAKLERLASNLSNELRPLAETLIADLHQAYQQLQQHDELPWVFNEGFSQALLALLIKLQLPATAPDPRRSPLHDLPERLDFVTTLYVARAQIGGLRPAREQGESYLSQDIDRLAQDIDHDLHQANWPTKQQPELNQLLADARLRWKYIAHTLLNYRNTPPAPMAVHQQTKFIANDLRRLRTRLGG